MVVNVIGVIFIVSLYGSLCFALGLFITGANRSLGKNNIKSSDKTYEVKVRYLQSEGFTKTYLVKATSKETATRLILKMSKYNLEPFTIYSIVSVKELNSKEDNNESLL